MFGQLWSWLTVTIDLYVGGPTLFVVDYWDRLRRSSKVVDVQITRISLWFVINNRYNTVEDNNYLLKFDVSVVLRIIHRKFVDSWYEVYSSRLRTGAKIIFFTRQSVTMIGFSGDTIDMENKMILIIELPWLLVQIAAKPSLRVTIDCFLFTILLACTLSSK